MDEIYKQIKIEYQKDPGTPETKSVNEDFAIL